MNIIQNLANIKEHLIIPVTLLCPDAFVFSTGSSPLGQEVIAYFLAHFSDRSGVVNDLLGGLQVFSRSATQPAALCPAPSMPRTKKIQQPGIRSAARRRHGDDTGSLQRFPSCEIPAMSQTRGRKDNSGVSHVSPALCLPAAKPPPGHWRPSCVHTKPVVWPELSPGSQAVKLTFASI